MVLEEKLGQELLEHPEYGDKFIEPVKSQGVYMMEDSAMIMRVQFKTKPGDQFMIRKDVYAKVRELFEKNDIHFAHNSADETGSFRDKRIALKKRSAY